MPALHSTAYTKNTYDNINLIKPETRSPLNNKTRHARSHISIESSLLNETPQKQSNQYRSQSQKQLNSNNLDGSRTSQGLSVLCSNFQKPLSIFLHNLHKLWWFAESPDVNMNSSNLTDASYATNDIFRGHQHSTLAAHPSLLGIYYIFIWFQSIQQFLKKFGCPHFKSAKISFAAVLSPAYCIIDSKMLVSF